MLILDYFLHVIKIYFGKLKKNLKTFCSQTYKIHHFLSISNENGGSNIYVNISEIRVPPPSEFLIFGICGCKGIT